MGKSYLLHKNCTPDSVLVSTGSRPANNKTRPRRRGPSAKAALLQHPWDGEDCSPRQGVPVLRTKRDLFPVEPPYHGVLQDQAALARSAPGRQ